MAQAACSVQPQPSGEQQQMQEESLDDLRQAIANLNSSLAPGELLDELCRSLYLQTLDAQAFSNEGGVQAMFKLLGSEQHATVARAAVFLQALAAREDAGAVFATAIFGQHTLSVATETLLQVVRRTELTAEARMAAAAVLAHLACPALPAHPDRDHAARTVTGSTAAQAEPAQDAPPLWAQLHAGAQIWHAETAAALLDLLLLESGNDEIAAAAGRMLTSVIFSAASTQGGVIKTRDLQVLVSAIADCEREVSQRAAVQVVTCVAGVQQSNLTAAVQSGILKALVKMAEEASDSAEVTSWAIAFFAVEKEHTQCLIMLGGLNTMIYFLRSGVRGVRRAALRACMVMAQQAPILTAYEFASREGIPALLVRLTTKMAYDGNRQMLADSIALLRMLLASQVELEALVKSLNACDAIPLLGSCVKMHFPEVAQPASACLLLVARCNRSFRSSSGKLSAEGSAMPDTRSDDGSAPAPSSEPVTDATLRIGSQELGPHVASRQASEDEPAFFGRLSTGSSVRQAPQHQRTTSGSSTEAASSVGGPRSSASGGQQALQRGQAGMSQPGPSRPQAAPHGERAARVQHVVPARLNAVPQAPPGGYTSLRIIGGKVVYVSHDGKQVPAGSGAPRPHEQRGSKPMPAHQAPGGTPDQPRAGMTSRAEEPAQLSGLGAQQSPIAGTNSFSRQGAKLPERSSNTAQIGGEACNGAGSVMHRKGGQTTPGGVPGLRSQADSPAGSEVNTLEPSSQVPSAPKWHNPSSSAMARLPQRSRALA